VYVLIGISEVLPDWSRIVVIVQGIVIVCTYWYFRSSTRLVSDSTYRTRCSDCMYLLVFQMFYQTGLG